MYEQKAVKSQEQEDLSGDADIIKEMKGRRRSGVATSRFIDPNRDVVLTK